MELSETEKQVIQRIAGGKDERDSEALTSGLSDTEANALLEQSKESFARDLKGAFIGPGVPQEAIDIILEDSIWSNCDQGDTEAVAYSYRSLARALNLTAEHNQSRRS